jgi:hypothetical protein
MRIYVRPRRIDGLLTRNGTRGSLRVVSEEENRLSLFGPKKPCPHCARKVRQPKDPADYLCPNCGEPGPWASEEQVAAWNARAEARTQYRELVEALTSATLPSPDESHVTSVRKAAAYTPDELRKVNFAAFRPVAETAVADDIMTPDESAHLKGLMKTIGITWEDIREVDPGLLDKAAVSEINGGQFPEVRSPHILPKKGEIVHLECAASLMKEVAIRQYQGGYSGFSFPIGKSGIRYRVGGSRGRSVQIGTELEVADSGILAITNKRAVYAGSRKTVEMPYSKLVNLTVFSDGIQFHLSNRVNAPLFIINKACTWPLRS